MHRGFGNANAVAARRNAAVQVGQRLAVIEPRDLGHKTIDQSQQALGAVDKRSSSSLGLMPFSALPS